jgi:hypothetical protein
MPITSEVMAAEHGSYDRVGNPGDTDTNGGTMLRDWPPPQVSQLASHKVVLLPGPVNKMLSTTLYIFYGRFRPDNDIIREYGGLKCFRTYVMECGCCGSIPVLLSSP